MSQRNIVGLLVFVGILVLLNAIFVGFGVHEHIDIMGSVLITIALSIGLTWMFNRRGGGSSRSH
ncbi:MAG: hypothetical protein GY894_07925 [Planctomycetes bacterium]|jgi:nucleoside permease NupC|nr:hypothetical protein [Planctomycetota bacterium]MCP4839274.1 hypothetical protein [Planctomycetota bacterium]